MFKKHFEVPSISKRLSSDSIQGFITISLLHRISYAYICLCKMPRPGGGLTLINTLRLVVAVV